MFHLVFEKIHEIRLLSFNKKLLLSPPQIFKYIKNDLYPLHSYDNIFYIRRNSIRKNIWWRTCCCWHMVVTLHYSFRPTKNRLKFQNEYQQWYTIQSQKYNISRVISRKDNLIVLFYTLQYEFFLNVFSN